MKRFQTVLFGIVALFVFVSTNAYALMSGKKKPAKDETGQQTLPSPEDGWKTLCSDAGSLVADIRRDVQAGRQPHRRNFQEQKLKFENSVSGQPGFAGEMSAFYFDRILNDKDIPAIIKTVESALERARHYNALFKPLTERAETLDNAALSVRRYIAAEASKPAGAANAPAATEDATPIVETPAARLIALGRPAFTGAEKDELSLALIELDKALASNDLERASVWAAETSGAARRLSESVRWLELVSEWLTDYCNVLLAFRKDYDWIHSQAEFQTAGGWKNFMFGRLPGAQSIMYGFFDAAAADQLLSDVLVLDEPEKKSFGTLPVDSIEFEISPSFRDAFRHIRDGLPKAVKSHFDTIPGRQWELGIFHANIWIWDDEKRLDDLIATLVKYDQNYKTPSFIGMMEIIHVKQGAWGASNTIKDRYHSKIMEWAAKLEGKKNAPVKPEDAAMLAWRQSNEFYGGKYAGSLWTLTEAIEARKLDCIRISQMIGCIYANAGFAGVHPVRIHRNTKNRTPLSGHTMVDFMYEGKDDIKDGLDKASLGAFDNYVKGKTDLWSIERGYRSLGGFVSGEIHLPSEKKTVTVRMPYYEIKRDPLVK